MKANDILTNAGRAVGKVYRDGKRGVTNLSMQEIEALVIHAAATGVPALKPDERINDRTTPKPEGETP